MGKLRLWRAEQQRKSQSGWQACSRADHRKAGRQEVWGGRLQRKQTAGMLNYHTSVHDMSTPLTTARRLYPVQSRVTLWRRWFLLWLSVLCLVPPLFKPEWDRDNLPHVMVILSFYLIRDQSVLRGQTLATEDRETCYDCLITHLCYSLLDKSSITSCWILIINWHFPKLSVLTQHTCSL